MQHSHAGWVLSALSWLGLDTLRKLKHGLYHVMHPTLQSLFVWSVYTARIFATLVRMRMEDRRVA